MVHEIFIVEDNEELINNLKLEFKGNKDIFLKHIIPRRTSRTIIRYTCINSY